MPSKHEVIFSLPNDNILDSSKFKAFADNKLIFNDECFKATAWGWVENIAKKKCWLPAFSPGQNVFKRSLFDSVGIYYRLKSQKRPTRKVFVYKIQVDPIHTILKYGNYYDFMDR